MADAEQKADAQELKKAGNDAFARGDWKIAVEHFTTAIKLDPTDQVFYSNRSGAYANLAKYQDALKDALKCVELKPDWWKAWSRKGFAEYHLKDFAASEESYEKGMKLNPQEKSLVEGRDKARNAQRAGTTMGDMQKLSTAEIQERLRNGIAKLSVEELQAELAKAGIDSKGKSKEEMAELLLKAPQQTPDGAAAKKPPGKSCLTRCLERCCPGRKYAELTPGEKYLEKRRKFLAKWKDWDEKTLKKQLQKLGEAAPQTEDRDELVDLLLQAEMKRQQEQADPARFHKYGLIGAVVAMLVTFVGITLFLIMGQETPEDKSTSSGGGQVRRQLQHAGASALERNFLAAMSPVSIEGAGGIRPFEHGWERMPRHRWAGEELWHVQQYYRGGY